MLEEGRVHKPEHISFLVYKISLLVLFVVASKGVLPQILGEDSPAEEPPEPSFLFTAYPLYQKPLQGRKVEPLLGQHFNFLLELLEEGGVGDQVLFSILLYFLNLLFEEPENVFDHVLLSFDWLRDE